MNYSYASRDTATKTGAGMSKVRHDFRDGRKKEAKAQQPGSAKRQQGKLAPVRPEAQEWEAFQEIYLASRGRFVALAYGILRNKEDAEDAVQDAILSAYRHFRSFEGRSACTTWFTRIVMNAALMIRRKHKSSRIESLPESVTEDMSSWIEKIADERPNPEMACAGKEMVRLIDGSLEKMCPALQQAFRMTYYEEVSGAEGGDLVGVSTETFKSRVHRAKNVVTRRVKRCLVMPMRRKMEPSCSLAKDRFKGLATLAIPA